MTDEDYEVIQAMRKYGGGFIQALAVAFERADIFNFTKLKNAFPEYWDEFKFMSEQEKENNK